MDTTVYNSQLTDMRTAEIRTFATGATRSSDNGKPEYAGYLSPRFIKAFGQYMLKHQVEYILIDVPRYGWLCRITKDGNEIYRGEYQMTYFEAMEKALEWQEEQG